MTRISPPIYTPAGAALEYGAHALNIYQGCAHGCRYSYNTRRLSPAQREFYHQHPHPRPGFLEALKKQLPRFAQAHPGAEVFGCFTCDPWQPIEAQCKLTRQTIALLDAAGLRSKWLSKAGALPARDFDLLSRVHGQHKFGITLTGLDEAKARRWEPGAASPLARVDTLEQAHLQGIGTWVSLEPVIYPELTLAAICATHRFVEHFAVGKLNHFSLAAVRAIDPEATPVLWPAFRAQAVELLEGLGFRRLLDPRQQTAPGERTYYLKRDLVEAR